MGVIYNPFTGDLQFYNTSSGGSSVVTEVTADPGVPDAGQVWLLDSGSVGSPGLAMGVMGLTYSRTEVNSYDLSVKVLNGDIKRTALNG